MVATIYIYIHTYSCSSCIMFVFQGGLVFQVLFFYQRCFACFSIVSVIPELYDPFSRSSMTVVSSGRNFSRLVGGSHQPVSCTELQKWDLYKCVELFFSGCGVLVFKLKKWWCGRVRFGWRVPWSPLVFLFNRSDVKNPLIRKGWNRCVLVKSCARLWRTWQV